MKLVGGIYGCIQSSLLWYNLYANTLNDMGFDINPYENFISNKMINRNQFTIGWYVDYNKTSHKEAKVVDDMLTIFKETFGDLTITRGSSHGFLGMDMTIIKEKRVDIAMKKYVRK